VLNFSLELSFILDQTGRISRQRATQLPERKSIMKKTLAILSLTLGMATVVPAGFAFGPQDPPAQDKMKDDKMKGDKMSKKKNKKSTDKMADKMSDKKM
jgi:hypothetical protein